MPAARVLAFDPPVKQKGGMTFLWFVIWLIANNVGGHEPLLLDLT